jgi:hypothetical protein
MIELFTQKIVTKLSKIWVWDPGSEIRDPEKTYSESRIQGSKRHGIPDPEHCRQARRPDLSLLHLCNLTQDLLEPVLCPLAFVNRAAVQLEDSVVICSGLSASSNTSSS